MEIVVLGATGFVGGAVARQLVADGHRVQGLARSVEAGTRLESQGIVPLPGNLDAERAELIAAAAAQADAVVFAAQLDPRGETETVAALLDALAGSGKTMVFTSGSGVHLERTGGAWSENSVAEDDPFVVEPLAAERLEVEQAVRAAADRQLRTMVIRPGMIWGPGDHGHVSMIYQSVAATGSACYVGQGLNTYSHVHIDDVARLYATALETATAGALYHAVAGETPTRWIAEAVAADLGCGTRSLSAEEAEEVWGEFGALIMGASSRGRAPRTRRELGWAPRRTDMLTMIGDPRLRALGSTVK